MQRKIIDVEVSIINQNSKRYKNMQKFAVTLQHDNGKIKLIVTAESMTQARELACLAENCPTSAILSVLPVKNKKEYGKIW